jgi:tetratricopeptide (TPR) repeat protein
MMDTLLADAKKMKADAKSLRDIGEVNGALASLEKVTAMLESALKQEGSSTDTAQVNAQLADSLGMKGGILRRAGRLPEALKAYQEGLKYESGDSYNLTNSLVLELLINPSQLPQLKARILDARNEVERQIREERRGRQWWAWADLGLLDLLCGNEVDADAAYSRFADTGARAFDYDSTISVLNELATKFGESHQDDVQGRLTRASDLLKRHKR